MGYRKKIFGNFTSGGDYVAALLCFSSLGHDWLIGTQYVLKKNTSDRKKIFGNLTSGGDYVAALLCFSSLGHNWLIGTQHVLKKNTSDGKFFFWKLYFWWRLCCSSTLFSFFGSRLVDWHTTCA